MTRKAVLITNIPAPYRVPVFSNLADLVHVVFLARNEKNRSWQIDDCTFEHTFLEGEGADKGDGYNFTYNNPEIVSILNRLKPDVVITSGFNWTHLYAFAWAKLYGVKHVTMTDGTLDSEAGLSVAHKIIRKIVYLGSSAFIAASKKGFDLYRAYNVRRSHIFQSHLCANVNAFKENYSFHERPYDLMFSGQFHERKLPFFFVDVCKKIKQQRGRVRVLLIGDGPLRNSVLEALRSAEIDYEYPGFVQQTELPQFYGRAKVFLFTTRLDPWGVVANEALAAGTPVITTPAAGVAGELVVDGVSGYVIDTDVDRWAVRCAELLSDHDKWHEFSQNGRQLSMGFNYSIAADGVRSAIYFALSGERS